MKILNITNNYPTNTYPIFGIFVKEQIESLKTLNLNCEVFFINGREKGKMEYVKSIFKLRKYLQNNTFDIIHCHHALSALCLILSGQKHKSKVIVSYQSDPENEIGLLMYNFIKKNVNACIFKNNSELINKNIFSYYLANGVNTSFFKEIEKEKCYKLINLDISKKYILFVSSNFIRKEKRYDLFLKVIEILKNKYKWNNIEKLTLINTKRELVPYYYNCASLHLLTSDFEGSPNSVKESMACNTPVVSTPVGDVKEMLSGASNCFVSNSFDAEELAFLCNKALKTKGNPRELILKKKIDIESVANKLKDIYIKILNN